MFIVQYFLILSVNRVAAAIKVFDIFLAAATKFIPQMYH